MKDIIVEIDGRRHRLEEWKEECTGCDNCSLSDLCLAADTDVLFCERVNEMFGEKDVASFSLYFKLDEENERKQ
jgi:hypothetical protein